MSDDAAGYIPSSMKSFSRRGPFVLSTGRFTAGGGAYPPTRGSVDADSTTRIYNPIKLLHDDVVPAGSVISARTQISTR